ncbi:MAG: hypothetical protein AB7P67_14295, partial [Vicinamibacterales bacterium]
MMRPFVVATLGLTAAVAFLVGLLVGGGRGPAEAPSAAPPSPREFTVSAPPLPAGAMVSSASFADVAEHLNPTVVNIDATSRGSAWGGGRRFTPSLPERPDMFDRPFQRDRDEGREGLGTGFVFDPSGLILT